MRDICLDNHELQTLSRPGCWDGRRTDNYPLSGVTELWGWQSQHLPVAIIRDLKRCLPHNLMRPEILSATLNLIILTFFEGKNKTSLLDKILFALHPICWWAPSGTEVHWSESPWDIKSQFTNIPIRPGQWYLLLTIRKCRHRVRIYIHYILFSIEHS